MDDLPHSLILEIMNRLHDSSDLARCRIASKILNALSREVSSLKFFCSRARYFKSRSVETRPLETSFKLVFKTFVTKFLSLDSLSIGVENSFGRISDEYDEVEDESDDLYFTDVGFAREWLPGIGGGLKFLSISDFWVQSCWRRSEILALITSCCHNLVELDLKNAWLSVDGMKRMSSLKRLTLEFIRLDDEDLSKVNYNFPNLEVLNFIGVGDLSEPRICLSRLKTCYWSVSNAPVSLSIFAPNLLKLKLTCVRPKSLIIETPMLYDLYLSMQDASGLRIKEFPCLKRLQVCSPSHTSLITTFASARTIRELTLYSLQCAESVESAKFCLDILFDMFPNLSFLELGPGAWSEAEISYRAGGLEGRIGMGDLKKIHANSKFHKIELKLPFILSVLDKCDDFVDMTLLINRDANSCFAGNDMSKCATNYPRVRWRWELWKEGTKEAIASGWWDRRCQVL